MFYFDGLLMYCLGAMVQIVGESLPISSSGHFELLQRITNLYFPHFGETVDLSYFYNVLQIFSAIIFLCYFFRTWWKLVVDRPITCTSLCDVQVWRKNIVPVILFGLVADGITFLFWYGDIAERFQFSLTVGFVITALALWSMQFAQEKQGINIWALPYGCIVGIVQGLALFPGISRFATTMAALQWLGYQRRIAFAVSFLLQWPLLVGMSIKIIVEFYQLLFGGCSIGEVGAILNDGVIACSIIFLLCICALLPVILAAVALHYVGKMIDKNILWKFSYYMIIPISLSLIF
ncbi:MAG: undecaprenyl-diphosphate phosphatase [Candidatus Chromulinivorax sp.]|nr:undecaprenyl-diphosphate phosphatase [Candidatus Chromulinivorax sp.]